jgi:hypothetical protein
VTGTIGTFAGSAWTRNSPPCGGTRIAADIIVQPHPRARSPPIKDSAVTLDEIDRRVLDADGGPVLLDTCPTVYDAGDRYTLEPAGAPLPVPDDELALFLLANRYPGVPFELPDEFPGFREAAPEPDFTVSA